VDSLFKFGVTLLDGIQGRGVDTDADRLSFRCRAHPPSRVACALGPHSDCCGEPEPASQLPPRLHHPGCLHPGGVGGDSTCVAMNGGRIDRLKN